MKKKILSIALTMAFCATAALTPAYAATANQDSQESLSTEFTFEMPEEVQNDPTYTITIPEAVTIAEAGTQVDIKAENVANLGGKKISVTLAGTDYFRNQMVLEGEVESGPRTSIRYQFVLADNTVLETTGKDTATGTELVSFTEDGTASYTVRPVLSTAKKGITYRGSVTYGIELKDIG